MTYKEIIYMVLDEIKSTVDDSFITEDHALFLLKKNRVLLLKQRYSDIKKQIPESNYQTICLNFKEDSNDSCDGDIYLKSEEKVPYLMKIATPSIYPVDYYNTNITFISRDRMKYVGYNKYMRNIIYASLGPDNHLYLKSNNPQFIYLEKAKLTGIFEDIEETTNMQCSDNPSEHCGDFYDSTFPIEDGLVPDLIKLTVQELSGVEYRPEDSQNNSADDLSDLIAWARRNMKSDAQKQIEGQ